MSGHAANSKDGILVDRHTWTYNRTSSHPSTIFYRYGGVAIGH